jgi:hypothetical protein
MTYYSLDVPCYDTQFHLALRSNVRSEPFRFKTPPAVRANWNRFQTAAHIHIFRDFAAWLGMKSSRQVHAFMGKGS